MTIYLLKTPELSEEKFQNTCNLLETFEGPLKFLKVDLEFDKEKFPFLKKFYPDFKFKYASDVTKIEFNQDRGTPLSWQELFSLCTHYRETFNIEKTDFVVLLTSRRNALNWFSSVDNSQNIFVHTNEWDSFTNANPKYPIAYQVLENIMQFLMKLDIENLNEPNIHKNPKGCMNDFCNNKEDVILKLQTANICDKCMEKIHAENIDTEIIEQAFRIFEGVRNELIFKKRTTIQKKAAQLPLTITNRNKILIDKLNLEIRLKPMEKALYIFYLKQKEGVLFKNMVDYQSDLFEIYGKISTSDDTEVQEERIRLLVNPLENSFNVQKARINKTITDLLGEEIAQFYKIDGTAGNPFKINLSKDLIQFQY